MELRCAHISKVFVMNPTGAFSKEAQMCGDEATRLIGGTGYCDDHAWQPAIDAKADAKRAQKVARGR